jgi:hypothetical protein
MAVATKCPSCRCTVTVPEEQGGKKILCPECAYAFVVAAPSGGRSNSQAREEPVERPRGRSEARLTREPVPRSSVARRDEREDEDEEPRPRKASRATETGPLSGLLLPVLLAGVAGAFLLFLLVAGVGLWWLLRAGPAAVAPAAIAPVAPPVVAGGKEEGAVPPGPAGAATGKVWVVLSGGTAQRAPGRPGMVFQVKYRFTEGAPAQGGVRYNWIIQTARGQSFKRTLTALDLRPEGTLEGRATGTVWIDGPYRTYLAVEKLVPGRGLQEEKLSEVLTIR